MDCRDRPNARPSSLATGIVPTLQHAQRPRSRRNRYSTVNSSRSDWFGLLTTSLMGVAALWLPCAYAAGEAESVRIERVLALIGGATCDTDSQCRTIAIGSKPCGGPEAYVAWSTKVTDAAALNEANANDNVVQAPERGRLQSNCIVVTDPGAYCARGRDARQGICRLRDARQGGRGPVN